MTSFAEFWERLVTKKPKLADKKSEVQIKSGEFRKLLEAAWKNGRKCGEDSKSTFEQIFGKVTRR